MYTVGRLISQGVYTVSGPFHPFGGAVDIVVVQQEDGSLKSSPWYVKFGKFQGVLKAKMRVVDINVNGVDAGFHMYLDPRGEAYFLREVDKDEVVEAGSLCSSSCEGIDGNGHDKIRVSSKSMNYEFDECKLVSDVNNSAVLARTNSKGSRILGSVLGKRSVKEHKEEKDSNVVRMTQLESAEIAADLLELRWSTNLLSRRDKVISREVIKDDGDVTSGRLETSLVLHEQHFVNKLEDSPVDHEVPAIKVEETIVTNVANGVSKDIDENLISDDSSRTQLDDANQGDASIEVVSCSSTSVPTCQNVDDNLAIEVDEMNEIRPCLDPDGDFQVSEQFVEERLIFGDLDDSKPTINKIEQEVKHAGSESTSAMYCQEHSKCDLEGLKGNIRRSRSNLDIPRSCGVTEVEVSRQAKSLPNMSCHFNDPITNNHEDLQFDPPVGKLGSSNWDLLGKNISPIKKANMEKELPQNADNLSNDLKDGSIASGAPPNIVDSGGGTWRVWRFRRLGSKKDANDAVAETDVDKEWSPPKSGGKMHTQALTPTPEQLASLNLVEGKNIVTFTFSTSVLGTQKVDARIYLWRWDTRIVISDVDGTITKSDVLGQFMPLVGRDWSHIGVTHLFSAIKENGYQMLYLSARAISQASITRQFLFNLRQDGKALPDGPVVISPDGLFPSLFREVIRRVPHEFKIACLEDIRVCFPSDRNPFYAGFGNRHTDEFSYLKVRIPKGKIFIINPKGEVAINRSIDSRSYASLHALANAIFPPISVHEEEDYNSWNFWKLPPPTIE